MSDVTQDDGYPSKLRALLVEDNALDAELMLRELERAGCEVSSDRTQTEAEFRQCITTGPYDVILADYNLPQWRGMEALEMVRQLGLDIPFILVTGSLGEARAVECMNQGITDYILKDNLARLPVSLRRALQEKHVRQQKKQAETAMQESRNQLHAIIQSALDAIITIDEQQRIVLFNPSAERMFGCSAADAVGQPLDRFIPSRFREEHRQQVRDFGLSNSTRRKMDDLGILYGLRADGTEFPAEVSISQVKLGNSKLYTAIVRDITERRQVELELQASEERHRQLFERSASAIAVCKMEFDAQGVPCNFRYLEVNPAFEQMTGLVHDQVVDRPVLKLLPDLEHYWLEMFGEVVTTGEPATFEQYSRSLHRYYEGSAYRPRPGHFATSFMDVTERKRSQDQLAKKAADLARSNRDLEQFAYVASHDLQEPLRMVASYTQLLAERYRGKLDENADKYIGYAVEGAVRMQTLIQDLLAFSRVGRNGQCRTLIDCNLIYDLAVQNLQAAIEESHASIRHNPLPVVTADRSQLVQLFQNLIGNAIKFRGSEAPAISISAEKQADAWTFAVADNGIGIAPDHRENIFIIFQRLHTREEYSGNGIGLAICKKIVEQHGGQIRVDSEVGRGSIFRFTIPLQSPDQESRQA
ncbi:MAG: PAS domain S-box protein [Terriglobales bacterium]